jgi:hypothetical protein
MALEKLKQNRWLTLALYVAVLAGLSYGFMLLLGYLMAHFNVSVAEFATTAYLVVFLVTLASNAGIHPCFHNDGSSKVLGSRSCGFGS